LLLRDRKSSSWLKARAIESLLAADPKSLLRG